MFTEEYYNTLKRSQIFQQKSINWGGLGSYQYIQQLREIVQQHRCETMLDYGCGKGLQYPPDAYNFAQLIGIQDYAMHDPAYKKYAELPSGTWDLVICLDVLPFIPESDIDTVIDLMLSRCNKICVIALQKIPESKKNTSKKPFVCVRDHEWWQAKLSHEKIHLIWTNPTETFNLNKFIEENPFVIEPQPIVYVKLSMWARFKNFVKSKFF